METITIPVICDRCREEGTAGSDPFAAIRDLLEFEPVQRRAHVNGWKEEHQRAFIAALALTGSPRQAARALGRWANGAEQLRKGKGGQSFADAWQAALELYREREFFRIKDNLSALSDQQDQRDTSLAETHLRALPPSSAAGSFPYADEEDREAAEYEEGMASIRAKLLACRRLFICEISTDPAKRAAWEVLVGPVDWMSGDLADPPTINMREPGMVLAAATGMTDAVFGTDEERQAVFARLENNAEQFRRAPEEDQSREEMTTRTKTRRSERRA